MICGTEINNIGVFFALPIPKVVVYEKTSCKKQTKFS